MNEHREDSLIDKAKDALGKDDVASDDRAEGWAGVPDALDVEGDQPGGSIYGEDPATNVPSGDPTAREHERP